MIFNAHSDRVGTHAFLSASKASWVNYNEDKLARMYAAWQAARIGTEKHELAHRLIKLGIKLPDNGSTLSAYVNDAIGYGMKSEQTLYFSDNCYGTADTISFQETKSMLRIHDLKNGVIEASMLQLEVYVALFCLEYRHNPFDISAELRIYQNDHVKCHEPDPIDIQLIMAKIRTFDEIINEMKKEEQW